MISFKQFFHEGITPEPSGGWDVEGKPLTREWFEEKYKEYFDNWVPIKQTLLTGEVPDFTMFPGLPGERKMELRDIAITSRKERKAGAQLTLMDWVMGRLKEVITWTSSWIDADKATQGKILFRPLVDKKSYQDLMKLFRRSLVGFGNDPSTLFHKVTIQSAKDDIPGIEKVVDELFDTAREVQHYLARQGEPPKDQPPLPGGPQKLPPNIPIPPTHQSPEDDPNQGPY